MQFFEHRVAILLSMGKHLFELINVSMLFSNLFFYEGVWGIVQKEFLHWSGGIALQILLLDPHEQHLVSTQHVWLSIW